MSICAMAAMAEALFADAITPMLPALDSQFGLGYAMAGLLVASYAIGYGIGTYPAVRLVSSVGPRATTVIGAAILVAGLLFFAVGPDVGLLFLGLALGGFGGVTMYTGVIALATASAGDEHRGATIGTVYSGGYAGSALGPMVGAAALAFGRGPAFGLLAAAQLLITGLLMRLPRAAPIAATPLRAMLAHLGSAQVRLGLWITSLPGFGLGVLMVSGTYRIQEVMGTTLMTAAAFGGIAVINVFAGPVLGNISDKMGRRQPLLVLMTFAAILLGMLIGVEERIPLVILIAIGGAIFSLVDGPGFALVGDGVQMRGGNDAEATFLMNLFWGPSAALGAILAGVFHGTGGAMLSFAVLAGITGISAVLVQRFAEG